VTSGSRFDHYTASGQAVPDDPGCPDRADYAGGIGRSLLVESQRADAALGRTV
jgi:hypothetical protein